MSEPDLLPPAALGASARERRLARGARWASAGTGLALLFAAADGSAAAAAGALVAIAASLHRRPRQPDPPWVLRIDARGRPTLRRGTGAEEPATVQLLAPWLIVLRCGRLAVALWPDGLAPALYRRASASLRWTPPAAADGPAPAVSRDR